MGECLDGGDVGLRRPRAPGELLPAEVAPGLRLECSAVGRQLLQVGVGLLAAKQKRHLEALVGIDRPGDARIGQGLALAAGDRDVVFGRAHRKISRAIRITCWAEGWRAEVCSPDPSRLEESGPARSRGRSARSTNKSVPPTARTAPPAGRRGSGIGAPRLRPSGRPAAETYE